MWIVTVVDRYMCSPATTLNSLVREKLNFQWSKNSIDFRWGTTTDFAMQFSVNLIFKLFVSILIFWRQSVDVGDILVMLVINRDIMSPRYFVINIDVAKYLFLLHV